MSARVPSHATRSARAAEHGEQQLSVSISRTSRAASGADRESHGNLAAARARASEQQVRDVDAGDEQHEADRAEQHEQRSLDERRDARVVERLRLAPHGRRERTCRETHRSRAFRGRSSLLGLLRRHAGLAARDDVRTVRLRLVQLADGHAR